MDCGSFYLDENMARESFIIEVAPIITPYTWWYNRIFTSKSWYKTQRHVRGWTGVSWRCFDVYRQYQEELWAETLRRNKVYLPLFFAISSTL